MVPSGQLYWQLFPIARNQSDIVPFGQNISKGFWNVTSAAYEDPMNIYLRYNTSVDSCVTDNKFVGYNFSDDTQNNISINTDTQVLFENMSVSGSGNLFTYTTINCSTNSAPLIIPYFCFFSLCDSCVKTSDWEEDCQWLE